MSSAPGAANCSPWAGIRSTWRRCYRRRWTGSGSRPGSSPTAGARVIYARHWTTPAYRWRCWNSGAWGFGTERKTCADFGKRAPTEESFRRRRSCCGRQWRRRGRFRTRPATRSSARARKVAVDSVLATIRLQRLSLRSQLGSERQWHTARGGGIGGWRECKTMDEGLEVH